MQSLSEEAALILLTFTVCLLVAFALVSLMRSLPFWSSAIVFGILSFPVAFIATLLFGWGGGGGKYDFFKYYLLFGAFPYLIAYSFCHYLFPSLGARHYKILFLVAVMIALVSIAAGFQNAETRDRWKIFFLSDQAGQFQIYDFSARGLYHLGSSREHEEISSITPFSKSRVYKKSNRFNLNSGIYKGSPWRFDFVYLDALEQQLYRCELEVDEHRLSKIAPRHRIRSHFRSPITNHLNFVFGSKGQVALTAGAKSDETLQEHVCIEVKPESLNEGVQARYLESLEVSRDQPVSTTTSVPANIASDILGSLESCIRFRDKEGRLISFTAIGVDGRRLGFSKSGDQKCSDDTFGVVKTVFIKTRNAKEHVLLWHIEYDLSAMAPILQSAKNRQVVYDFELFFNKDQMQQLRYFEYVDNEQYETPLSITLEIL